MRRVFVVTLSGVAVLCAFATLAMKSSPRSAEPPLRLNDGAASVDALLDELLQALAAKDEAALHRLRVTEAEYRELIVPGTVEEGKPLRRVSAQTATFFWRLLDAKNRDLGRIMLQEFGGQPLERRGLTYTHGVKKYGGYTAYGQVRLQVANQQGREMELRTGTIAEVDGRYKFIGINWED